MTNDRSDAQASGSSDNKGWLVPPIVERSAEFQAMKKQVEREERDKEKTDIYVVQIRKAFFDLLDAKEREVAELQRRITHSDFHRSKALRKIRGQRRNIKDMERKIERLQAAYNALLNLPVKGIEAKLRQQMQHESDKAFQRMKQLHALQAKLDAVKSAHPMVSDAGQREHCGACIKPWPCDTIKALDAD